MQVSVSLHPNGHAVLHWLCETVDGLSSVVITANVPDGITFMQLQTDMDNDRIAEVLAGMTVHAEVHGATLALLHWQDTLIRIRTN